MHPHLSAGHSAPLSRSHSRCCSTKDWLWRPPLTPMSWLSVFYVEFGCLSVEQALAHHFVLSYTYPLYSYYLPGLWRRFGLRPWDLMLVVLISTLHEGGGAFGFSSGCVESRSVYHCTTLGLYVHRLWMCAVSL